MKTHIDGGRHGGDRVSRVKHLRVVEGLSIRQIAMELSISKKTVSKILNDHKVQKQPRQHLLSPYESLIAQWYAQHPSLQAQQVYKRLRSYGYPGKYTMVAVHTRKHRRKRTVTVYHELQFLPGQEAQVDWMHFRLPPGVLSPLVTIPQPLPSTAPTSGWQD